ncbi:MAG: undecaprenyl/decaprenyl-phosphate alpha-N-acetylglucosaminyl 1-phosphate transferase [Thermogutta sp.]|uniref:glycosyltransferase family 4 protein n=1 Tax=Thermogutta sp. TaxID=1962930 RepID=UPI0019B70AFF|nr:MraY family glycosyltransferase [Thermogutta sp.]MBC7352252.1 undecaprenyl/decaprenyl-phosphate alpha-N-acetylglucosaminyl 1-phosphate transferase [Thermogutta sp.]
MWWLFFVIVPSLVVSWLLGFALRVWAPRWGLVDRPGPRKVHNRPMPTSGGLAIWLGVVLPFAVLQGVLWLTFDNRPPQGLVTPDLVAGVLPREWLPDEVARHLPGVWAQSGRLWTVLAMATLVMLLGLADDRWKLPWWFRLLVEFLVAGVTVAEGYRLTLFIEVPLLTGILSILWIVALINAFNMMDNMDGLAAGVAAIACTVLAAVMLLTPKPLTGEPQLFVAGFFLVLLGALLGFLWHNHPPARLFMGDAGSYFVGYLLAVISMTATFAGENTPRHAVLAPLCALAVPLYDLVTVVVIRVRAGASPFVGDTRHFSHRLVELGMTKAQAVLTIYLMAATCGLGALLLHQVNTFGAMVILLLVGCMISLIAILETTGRRAQRRKKEKDMESPSGPRLN